MISSQMELALFTHGAYVWPVHRNFESFIAALGAPAAAADAIVESPAYPADARTAGSVRGLPARLDQRLAQLHRDLYDALLRPIELAERERRSFADFFFSDLRGTAVEDLLAAFTYYFIRRVPAEMPVAAGLSVLRAVFFNHEVDEPGIWLSSAVQRLATGRSVVPERRVQFAAPGWAKTHGLAFVLVSERDRPAGSPGWITGQVQRQQDGRCQVRAEYGMGPSLAARAVEDELWSRLDGEARTVIERVFGWGEEAAA